MSAAKKAARSLDVLTSTVQKNRKDLPKDLKRMRLQNHEKKVFRHLGNMMAVCWKDQRLIFMLNSGHNCESEICVHRVRGEREEEVKKPIAISDDLAMAKQTKAEIVMKKSGLLADQKVIQSSV